MLSVLRKLLAPGGSARPEESEADFRLLTENSADIICRVGRDMRARYVSPSARRVLGWSPDAMVGADPERVIVAEDLPAMRAAAARLLSGAVDSVIVTFRMRRKDGTTLWLEGTARSAPDPETGAPGDTVLVMRDISERKQHEQKLSTLALTDALTGLANRRAFDVSLEREWRRTLRERTAMSLLLLDIDRFKLFNDHYGHQDGDDCLRAVATAVADAARRPGDIAARYGGEEIAVILPGTDATGALALAERVHAAVAALRLPHAANPEGEFRVSVSLGVATTIPRAGGTIGTPEALLGSADRALYDAKNKGRNRIATALLLSPDENVTASLQSAQA